MLPGLCQATDFAGVIQQAGNWAVAISDLLQVCQPECQPDEKAKTIGHTLESPSVKETKPFIKKGWNSGSGVRTGSVEAEIKGSLLINTTDFGG